MRMLFIVIIIFLGISVRAESSLPIDLTAMPVYVKNGFDLLDIRSIPEQLDESWVMIPGNANNRSIRIIDLPFSDIPKRKLFSSNMDTRHFTFLFKINLDESLIRDRSVGLHLAQIGENWEVFVNGNLVKSAMFLDKDDNVTVVRSVRSEIIEMPVKYLLSGDNIIAFHIAGDPTKNRTGFYMAKNYYIDYYTNMKRSPVDFVNFMLYGIYLIFGMYHLFLYVRRPKDKFNLAFGLAGLLIFVYFVFRSNFIFSVILDTNLIKRIELATLIAIMPMMVWFFDSIIFGKMRKFTKIYLLVSLFFVIAIQFAEVEFLLAWQYTAIIPIGYIIMFNIGIPFYKQYRLVYDADLPNNQTAIIKIPLLLLKTILMSIPGNLMLGMIVVSTTIIIDIVRVINGNPGTFTQYGFFVFIIGLIVMLANRFMNVHNQMEVLNITLDEKVKDRTKKLQNANEELHATMEELEAMNDNLVRTNSDLEEAQRIAARDMKMATQVQSSFFPKEPYKSAEWDTAFLFKPMAGVAGDLYDFYFSGTKLYGISMFDVSGHGIASGLITILARSIVFRRFMKDADEPSKEGLNEILQKINKDLITELGNVDYYLTGMMLRLNNTIEYVNAGHTDLLYRSSKTGSVKIVEPKGVNFKGHFLGIPDMQEDYYVVKFELQKNDMLLIYSDCLIESVNNQNEQFSIDRLTQILEDIPNNISAQKALDYIMKNFYNFLGDKPLNDDLSVILLQKK